MARALLGAAAILPANRGRNGGRSVTQSIDGPVVTRRFVHPNGTVSHFHVRNGRVLLTSVHPEHTGDPAEMDRAEFLRAWDKVAEDAEAEGLTG